MKVPVPLPGPPGCCGSASRPPSSAPCRTSPPRPRPRPRPRPWSNGASVRPVQRRLPEQALLFLHAAGRGHRSKLLDHRHFRGTATFYVKQGALPTTTA